MAGEMDPKAAAELAENTKLVGEYAEEALDSFQKQLRVVTQMRDAMEEVAKVMYALCKQDCEALNPEAWKKVTKEVLKSAEAQKKATKAVKDMDLAYKKFTQTLTVVAGALSGLIQGFKNLFAIGRGVAGFLGGMIDTLWSVGKAILAIPFKMLDGLFDMANQGGSNELKTALEAIRKEFGDLRGDASRAIVDTAKGMKDMGEYGLNATRIFGDLAGRVKAATEMVMGMGSAFQVFKGEVHDSGWELMLMQKGLGITNEQMAGVATMALRTGGSLDDVMVDMTKQSRAMGAMFGVTAKVISKDMAKALQDTAHFGSLSSREMALAATYANKMGISIEKLTGIMDATKTYDQTVDGMSKLNETYGTNIDYMKMMKMENPAKSMAYLREEFAKTGKDMSQLTRFDRDLIKQVTNYDDATIASMFSTKNATVSYEKMEKASAEVAKTTMTTSGAIKTLKKDIEELTPAGDTVAGGPFDHFLEGIARGIKMSPEFIGMMANIRTVLREAIYKGVEFGKKFVEAFPGVKEVFEGIKEYFDPAKWRKLWDGIISTFDKFTKDSTQNVSVFIDSLKKNFLDFFDSSKGAGQKVLDGFRKFGTVIIALFSDIGAWALEKLAGIIDSLTSWIQNPKLPQVPTGPWEQMFAPLQKVFDKLVDVLWPAIQRMAGALWDKLVDALFHTETGNKVLMAGFAVVFGPAILGAISGAITAGIFKGVGRTIFGAIAGEISNDKAGANVIPKQLGAKMSEIGDKAADTAETVKTVTGLLPDADKMKGAESSINWKNIAAIFAGMLLVVGAFALMVSYVASHKDDFTFENIGKTAAIFLAVSAAMVPMAALIAALSLVKTFDKKAVTKAIVAAAAVLEIGVVAFLVGAQLVAASGVEMGTIAKTTAIVGAISASFGAISLLTAGAAALGEGGKALAQQAAIGMGVMSAVLVAMVAVAGAIFSAIYGIGGPGIFQKLLVAVEFLNVLSNVFMKVGIIIGEAALVGAGVMTGLGGLAITAGLGAMGAAVTAMSAIAIGMMRDIMALPFDAATMKDKVAIFVNVMNTVTSLAGVIPKILESADVGILDRLSGDTVDKRMQNIRNIIQTLIDGVDGQGGIKGVIKELMTGLKDLLGSANVSSIKSLEVVGTVFGAVGSLVSTIGSLASAKIPNIKQEGKENLVQIISQVPDISKIMKDLAKDVPTLISAAVDLIKGIPQDKDFLARVKTLGDIIELINKVVSTVGGAINKTQENVSSIYGDKGPIIAIGKQMDFIYDVFRMLAGDVSLMAGGRSLAEVVWMIGQVPNVDKSTIDRAKGFSDFFETIAKINKSIFESTGGSLPDAAAANAKIGEMGRSMYSIYWFMKHLQLGSDGKGNINSGDDGVGSIGKIKDVMDSIATKVSPGSGDLMKSTAENLQKIFEGLSAFGNAVIAISGLPTLPAVDTITGKVTNIGATLDALKKLPEATSSIKTFSDRVTKNLGEDVIKSVAAMVDATQRLDSALATLPNFDMEAKMKAIAGGMGLGGGSAYTVKSKDVVINVSFRVAIDANELETTLVANKQSVLRDRINFLIDNTEAKSSPQAAQATIKSTGTPHLINTGAAVA